MTSPTPTRRTALIAGIAAGAVLLVAGTVVATLVIARSDAPTTPPAQQQAQAPSAPHAATTAASVSAAPTAAATPPGRIVLKFGAKAEGPKSTSVAYSYKQPVATKEPRPDAEGFEWGAADIEVCLKVPGTITRYSWHLTYADHTVIDPSGTGYGGFPAPAYPWDEREMAAGDCIRGWLTFAVPPGKKPLTVQYLPSTFAADWQVT